MASKKLRVNVVAGRNLIAKSGGKSSPYCEIVLLDDQGAKIGRPQTTKVIKDSLNPQWNHSIEFNAGSSFSGMRLRCWDKHKFRSDKFMGQVTVKYNTALLSSAEQLDEWFTLHKRKSKESVSGDIHLQIQYGDLHGPPLSETKSRSATVSDFHTAPETRISNFTTEETNSRLKMNTHIVIEEKADEDDTEDDYDKIRDGPSAAALEKATKDERDISFSSKNLEVTNNSNAYTMGFAKGNVKVNGGKWYFEVRIISAGQIQIGWCQVKFNPKTNKGGSCWNFDVGRSEKRKDGVGERYGERCNVGDIIGCALDLDAKTIQYWRNGQDLGVAFSDVQCVADRLCPIIGLSRRNKCGVNFGKEPFAFPQEGFNFLHSFLTEKEIEQLSKLFTKYRDLSNQALINEKKEEAKEELERLKAEGKSEEPKEIELDVELKETIHGEGLLEFQKDLDITDDEDPMPLIIAWKLKAETIWEISREEFMNGFTIYGCASLDKIKGKTKEWRDGLKKEQDFRHFYNFVFDYLKEDKKILLLEEALTAWHVILKDRRWPLFDDFEKFLRETGKKAISRDAWHQLWHFMKTCPNDFKDYDPLSSWPIVFDEFVEWKEK